MIHGIYSIALKLKTPSEQGKKLDFREKQEDLLVAIAEFNAKYRSWSKRLILEKIQNNFINVLLVIEKSKEKVSAREIRTFTAFLRRERNWAVYSRDTSKLFEGVKFTKISVKECHSILEQLDLAKTIYKEQEEDILNVKSFKTPELVDGKTYVKPSGAENCHDITDEQALAIFKYLIETKNLGSMYKQKGETILTIKDQLLKWV